jgi:catechol 2,3-dioxygenase-like lactoylglutathione lyase family enzyme
MSIRLDHTIVHSRDPKAAASFLAGILGLPAPTSFGPFQVVRLENGASLDFLDADGMKIQMQHYAFRVDEDELDAVFARVQDRGLAYWADPYKKRPGELYHHEGGRGLYFDDPSGHLLEVLTRPHEGGGTPRKV